MSCQRPQPHWSYVAGDLLAMTRGRLFITVTEGARLLELDPRTLRRSIEAHECPHVKINGTIRIPVHGFARWAGLDIDGEDSEAGAVTPASANDQPAAARKVCVNHGQPAA
jgi:hypothetical protein